MARYLCAVDVGTRAARAALFDLSGRMFPREVEPFTLHQGAGGECEYRAGDIWTALCRAVRRARGAAGAAPDEVAAIAFDATGSLVLTDTDGAPLPLGADGRDTFAWCDRRAHREAELCSRAGGPVTERLCGAISPEMQLPRLIWLRTHRPALWSRLGTAQDLADWIAGRAIGAPVHSVTCLGTKWPWHADLGGWQAGFLAKLDMADLPARLGKPARGQPVGQRAGGLSAEAARELGLPPQTPVAVGTIDGYAGALGCWATARRAGAEGSPALIAGTSASLVGLCPAPHPAPGLWGPFGSVLLPGRWSLEGGLSQGGAQLDRVLARWPAQAGAPMDHDRALAKIETHISRRGYDFAEDLQVLPDTCGERGPGGQTPLPAVVHGLRPDGGTPALCALYWRTAVALALCIGEVTDRMTAAGLPDDTLSVTGGMVRSPLLTQLFADATNRKLIVPETDCVLLGAAMAAAVAAGAFGGLAEAGAAMAPSSRLVPPSAANRPAIARDRRVRARMLAHRAEVAAR